MFANYRKLLILYIHEWVSEAHFLNCLKMGTDVAFVLFMNTGKEYEELIFLLYSLLDSKMHPGSLFLFTVVSLAATSGFTVVHTQYLWTVS